MDQLKNQDAVDWELVKQLKELIVVQTDLENQTDEYHRGLANGLILALSLVDGKDPAYLKQAKT